MSYLISKLPQLLFLLIAGTFFLLGLIKSKAGLSLLIFLIPFEGITIRGFAPTVFCMFGYFFGYCFNKSKNHESAWNNVHYRKYLSLIIFSLLLSLFALVFKENYSELNLGFGIYSVMPGLKKYMVNIVSCIMLYIIMTNEVRSHQDILRCIWAFVLSLSYVFISWIGSFVYNLGLPTFLQTRYAGEGMTYGWLHRFAGFRGEYGLMSEYFLIIMALSLVLIFSVRGSQHKRLISLIVVIVAVPMAISTGTRTFMVMLLLFTILSVFFLLLKSKLSMSKKIFMLFMIPVAFAGIFYQLRGTYLLERIEGIAALGQSTSYSASSIDILLNRPYSTTFRDIIEVGGLIGIGPIYVIGVRGNNMSTHSLYFDLIVKFGIIGLIIYFVFYFKLLQGLYKKIRLKNSIPAIILFSLLLPLLIGEYARSYQNQTSFMLMYWFLFAIIACVNKFSEIASSERGKG